MTIYKSHKEEQKIEFNNYDQVRELREWSMSAVSANHDELNQFHDRLIEQSVLLALHNIKSEWGTPPARFSFFLMGSGGRFEQSVWSDQDHGIIYECNEEHQPYFLALGTEISKALFTAGYEYCDGKVMASNPLWCKSIHEWENQIDRWLMEESLESLRYFSTFFDSRVIIGEDSFLQRLKEFSFSKLKENPKLYLRLVENVSRIRKGIGPFGQLLPASKGENTGTINLKETVFFTYVNSLRILALREEILVPSTLSRFQQLPEVYKGIKKYQSYFKDLLNFRLFYQKDAPSYDEVHLINVESMTKREKQHLKDLMKKGYQLFSETTDIINEDVKL